MKTVLAVLATFAILYSLDSQAQPSSPGMAVIPECVELDKFPYFLEKSGEKIIASGISVRNERGRPFTSEMFITVHPKTQDWTVFEVLNGKLCALGYGVKYKEFVDPKNFL